MENMTSLCIPESDLVPSQWPGRVTVKSHLAPDSRVSIHPDGSIGFRPNDTEIGPWELAYVVDGNKLVWKSDAWTPTGCVAVPLAKGV